MARGTGACKGATADARGTALPPDLTADELKTLATYEAQAGAYADTLTDGAFWEDELDRFEEILPNGHVCDVGSGNGRDAIQLSDRGYQVTGLDVSRALLNIAADREPRAHFVLGSLYALPFEDESLDGIWAAAVLLHVPKPRIREALSEFRRALRPGGILFTAVKVGDGEQMQGGPFGDRFFSYWQPQELVDQLNEAGLPVSAWHVRGSSGCDWLCLYAARPD
jgi:SAM-dependent methyltransferase